MTWFADGTNQTEAAKEHVDFFLAVEFDFPSGFTRLCSGTVDITINGQTYLATGQFGRVSTLIDRVNLTVERRTYQLAGAEIDPSIVSETDIDGSFGRSVVEYFGFVDPTTKALIAAPEINFEGEISGVHRVDGAESVIEVDVEHRFVLLEQADDLRYTHEHQQQFFAGDLGFDQVSTIETTEVLWGGYRVIPGVGGGRDPPNRRPP